MSYNFDNHRLYGLKVSAVKLKKSKDQIDLSLSANDINWDVKVNVSYGSKGLPSKVTQSLHPFLESAQIRFYYKY